MNQIVEIPGVGPVEFPASMSDADITKAIKERILPQYGPSSSTLGALGRTAASTADTALNLVTGALDAPARVLARAYYGGLRGMSGPELETKLQQETTSPKDVIGRAAGITGTPEYRGEAARRGVEAVGEAIRGGVVEPVAKAFRTSPEYVEDIGTALAPLTAKPGARAANVAGRALYGTEQAIRAAPGAAVDVAKGTARLPKRLAEGVIAGIENPVDQPAFSRPISSGDITSAREQGIISPLGETIIRMGGKTVPWEGKLPEAIAESATKGYKDITAGGGKSVLGSAQMAADLAGLAGFGVPFQGSLVKGSAPILRSLSPLRVVGEAGGYGEDTMFRGVGRKRDESFMGGEQKPEGPTYYNAEEFKRDFIDDLDADTLATIRSMDPEELHGFMSAIPPDLRKEFAERVALMDALMQKNPTTRKKSGNPRPVAPENQ